MDDDEALLSSYGLNNNCVVHCLVRHPCPTTNGPQNADHDTARRRRRPRRPSTNSQQSGDNTTEQSVPNMSRRRQNYSFITVPWLEETIPHEWMLAVLGLVFIALLLFLLCFLKPLYPRFTYYAFRILFMC